MRRYDIVFGIFLILSIINFALTAPVPVQEEFHARVDAMHIPKDVITVLEKRGNDDLDGKLAKVALDYLNLVKAVELYDAHASSSSALPGPDQGLKTDVAHASSSSAPPGIDQGSMDNVPAPPPNPTSSRRYRKLLMKPASTAPGMYATLQEKWWYDGPNGPMYTPMPLGHGSDHVSTGVHAPQPKPNPRPPPYNPYFVWNLLRTLKKPPPLPPASLIEFGQTNENQAEHVQDTNPGPSTDPDFDWEYWMDNLPSPERLKQGSSKELDDEAFQGPPSPGLQ
jgi:hypothetical protein